MYNNWTQHNTAVKIRVRLQGIIETFYTLRSRSSGMLGSVD